MKRVYPVFESIARSEMKGYTGANLSTKGVTSMPQWVTMAKAAEEVGVSPAKISRLAAKGRIRTRRDPKDERVKLVNLEEVRKLLTSKPDDDQEDEEEER
jgi:DNA-binding MarR family transcriptional regulator